MAKNKPERVILFLLFQLINFIILALPLRAALLLGKALGSLSFYILGKERKRALKNLNIAFGDSRSCCEKRDIVKRVFENLGMTFAEIVFIPKFTRDNIDRYVSCKDIKILRESLNTKRGAILLAAHFGNWELLAHYIALKGFPVSVIARRVRMEGLEAFLINIRKKNGINVLYRDASAKEVVDLLRDGQFVGIMPDQDMDSVSGVFVDFFGNQAWTPSGPSVMNYLTKAPIIPCFMKRKGFGHEVFIDAPLKLAETGDKRRDIQENTQIYTKVIEDYIRKFPDHWVWFHDRWKTKQ